MTDKQTLVIGDPPSLLNTRCVNWVDVVVVDGKCYDKDAVAKLLAERDALAAKLAKIVDAWLAAGSWPDTAEEKQRISDAIVSDPQQCLHDVQAEAGRAGWIACVDWLVENSSADLFTDGEAEQARDVGDQYAESVRQGGA